MIISLCYGRHFTIWKTLLLQCIMYRANLWWKNNNITRKLYISSLLNVTCWAVITFENNLPSSSPTLSFFPSPPGKCNCAFTWQTHCVANCTEPVCVCVCMCVHFLIFVELFNNLHLKWPRQYKGILLNNSILVASSGHKNLMLLN